MGLAAYPEATPTWLTVGIFVVFGIVALISAIVLVIGILAD
jgi:predicted signal transduction protein with EAL and GGDEF domain